MRFNLKYIAILFSMAMQCFSAASGVEYSVDYIGRQHGLRRDAFNANPKPTSLYSSNTENINTVLANKDKVSKTEATFGQKKTILQAVMAAELIRHETSTQERLGSLIPTLQPSDTCYWHFYILDYIEKLSSRLAVDIRRQNHITIDMDVLDSYLDVGYVDFARHSGIRKEHLLDWFNGLLKDDPNNSHFKGLYQLYIEPCDPGYKGSEERRAAPLATKVPVKIQSLGIVGVNEGQTFTNVHRAGLAFDFVVKKSSGAGNNCGYNSLDITRAGFAAFMMSRAKDPTISAEEKIELDKTLVKAIFSHNQRLNSSFVTNQQMDDLRANPTNALREAIINEVYLISSYMTQDDMHMASYMDQLKEQIICLWGYQGGSFKLLYVVRNGMSLIEDDAVFTESNRSAMKHIYYNGYNHFDKLIDQAVNGSK